MTRPWVKPLSVLLLAAAVVVAGCIGSAEAASAMQHRATADEAAKAWSPDAQLAQVAGAEGNFPGWLIAAAASAMGYTGSTENLSAASGDGSVGDGKAEVWIYRYLSPTREDAFIVVVDKAGNVVSQESDRRHQGDRALGAWTLDSDAALAKAKEANEGLRDGVAKEHFGVFAVLLSEGSSASAVWYVAGAGGDASGAGGGFVKLDAVTGEILASQGGFGSAGSWS